MKDHINVFKKMKGLGANQEITLVTCRLLSKRESDGAAWAVSIGVFALMYLILIS